MKNTRWILTAVAGCLLLAACTPSKEAVYRGSFLDSPYEIHVVCPPTQRADLRKWIQQIFSQAEQVLSPTDPQSELARFNASEKLTWLPASRALVTVVEEALRISKLSNGAWDVTAGKLAEIYRAAKGKPPGPLTLAEAKARVGFYFLEARQEPLALKKSRRGLVVDVLPLAPGYAVDEISEGLRRQGFSGFQVTVGAATRAAGVNGRGEVWPYSYRKPITPAQAPMHLTSEVIDLSNRAAATMAAPDSATATQEQQLVDPRSGKPLQTDLLSVTVLDLSALRAQAFALGLFSLGAQSASELARKQGMAAYLLSLKEEKGVAEATPLFPTPLGAKR